MDSNSGTLIPGLSNKTVGILAACLGVVILAIVYVASAFGYRSDCVHAEAGIKGQYKANQVDYDKMWKSFRETAQVPEMRAKDVEKVYLAVMQGRYGAEGSKALFQAIREVNPDAGNKLYENLQRVIEAGRTTFAAKQESLVDKKVTYEVILKDNRAAFVGMWFNFPTIDLDKFDVVTSNQTEEAFTSKKADEIKLR